MKKIRLAPIGRRIVSALIDIAVMGVIGCIFGFFVFYPMVYNAFNFPMINEEIASYQRSSYLYIYNDVEKKNYSLTELNYDYKQIDDQVYKYYTVYLKNEAPGHESLGEWIYTPYWYNVYIYHLPDSENKFQEVTTYEVCYYKYSDNVYERAHVDENQFPLDTAKPGYNIDNSNQDLYWFNVQNYSNAQTSLSNSNYISDLNNTISQQTMLSVAYAILVATAIDCLIIPLILPNGKTIGKLITKLVVLTDDGYVYKRWKTIPRYLVFVILELFGSFFTIGLMLILSYTILLFSKKRRCLHDMICFSVVADERHSVFFKDEEDEEVFKRIYQKEHPEAFKEILENNSPMEETTLLENKEIIDESKK